MDLSGLSVPLSIDEIDFRVQSINKGGYATILAYKDARCDMQRLDDVVGPLGWKREHSRDNHNCTVSIWDGFQWVSKEDVGVESNAESEKGLASDSFKRACFNWGIGRELYSYPVIQVKLRADEWENPDKPKATWKLKVKEWKWTSEWNDKYLVKLQAMDGDAVRYSYEAGVSDIGYTHEQKTEFDSLIESSNALGFLNFMMSLSADVKTALHNSFPKGKIVDMKKRANDLESEGHLVLDQCAEEIGAELANDDPHAAALFQEVASSGRFVKIALWKRLSSEEQDKLTAMVKGE